MKALFSLLLFSYTFLIGCSDNDESPSSSGNDPSPTYLTTCQGEAVRSILLQLTANDTLPSDFDQHTYEPTLGEVLDPSQPMVRSYRCNSLEEAELFFRGLVESDTLIYSTTDGMAVSLEEMQLLPERKQSLGTLTFHRDTSLGRMGFIEVAIPCIPRLQRIDFLPDKSWPYNATSRSAYKLGQVVNIPSVKESSSKTERRYCCGNYLCVRECDGSAPNGILVHFEYKAGYTDCSVYIDGSKGDGGWYPANNQWEEHKASLNDVYAYVNFLERYPDMKDVLVKYNVDYVMPYGFKWKNILYSNVLCPCIIYDGYISNVKRTVYYWRVVKYATAGRSAHTASSFRGTTFQYTRYWEWKNFLANLDMDDKELAYDKKIDPYTINVIHFGTTPIEGASVYLDTPSLIGDEDEE